jgi:putative holliday junction resolvase
MNTLQEKEMFNREPLAVIFGPPPAGRLLGIDPGTKKCGIAITDELLVTARPLPVVKRTNWKSLLATVKAVIAEYDAKGLVIGLPLESDGSDGPMTTEARDMARKFDLSLEIPVFLQDERSSSWEARRRIWLNDRNNEAATGSDSMAAVVILEDFIDRSNSANR